MNEESTVESPETELSTPSPVLILPGHLFFVDRIELPAALEDTELEDFAEISLENLAPFPIEQLYWGFLYSESAGSILLFAAYKERVKSMGYKSLEAYLWVLPDFATLWGARFDQPVQLLLKSPEGESELRFEGGDSLPEVVISHAPEAAPEGSAAQGIEVELESVKISEKGFPTFRFQGTAPTTEDLPGTWKKLTPSENALWRADVRDTEFKKSERSTRKLTTWITRATGYAALFAVLLLFLELVLYLGDMWLESKNEIITEQAPEVRRIEDKQSLMNKLDQVAQNELRPIAILEALNERRPEGIYFNSTYTEGQNRIFIEGVANTISEFNNYTNALSASGNFALLDSGTRLRGGETEFEATLDYIHREAPTSEEATTEAPLTEEPATGTSSSDEKEGQEG